MLTCANCTADAAYTFVSPATTPVNYCPVHMPEHLRERAAADQFPLLDPSSKAVKKTP